MSQGNFEEDPIVDPMQLALFAMEQEETKSEEDSTSADVETETEKKSVVSPTTSTAFPHKPRKKKSLAQLAAEAQQNSHEGKLVCPDCGCQDFRVTHTVPADGYRKRLRRCRNCGYPVNTVEFVLRD